MPSRPTFVFYGDSIVSGFTRGGSPDCRWSTLLSVKNQALERNFSADGRGFVALRKDASADGSTPASCPDILLSRVCATAADLIIICLGINDIPLMASGDEEVRAGIERDFSAIKAAHPDTPVLVTMYYPIRQLSDRSGRLYKYLETAAQHFGFIFSDAFVGILEDSSGNFCHDGIHPSTPGHVRLAVALQPLVDEVLHISGH